MTLLVGCDEACTVAAKGRIAEGVRSLGLDPDSEGLGAGVKEDLRLTLSSREARRLRHALRDGRRPKALLALTATDAVGNTTEVSRTVKQRLGKG